MLIKLSEENRIAPTAFEQVIRDAAKQCGCATVIAWSKPQRREIRFVLVDELSSREPATFEQHDQVIAMLLMIDRGAEIKTAKFYYRGFEDFQTQYANSLPGERNDAATEPDTNAG